MQAVPREFAEDAIGGLDFVEAQVRTATANGLAQRGMTLPATAEIEWWQTSDRDVADPRYTQRVGEPTESRLTGETRWVRGEPLAEDTVMLVCRLAGKAVPVAAQGGWRDHPRRAGVCRGLGRGLGSVPAVSDRALGG